jgi:hypothetical protein
MRDRGSGSADPGMRIRECGSGTEDPESAERCDRPGARAIRPAGKRSTFPSFPLSAFRFPLFSFRFPLSASRFPLSVSRFSLPVRGPCGPVSSHSPVPGVGRVCRVMRVGPRESRRGRPVLERAVRVRLLLVRAAGAGWSSWGRGRRPVVGSTADLQLSSGSPLRRAGRGSTLAWGSSSTVPTHGVQAHSAHGHAARHSDQPTFGGHTGANYHLCCLRCWSLRMTPALPPLGRGRSSILGCRPRHPRDQPVRGWSFQALGFSFRPVVMRQSPPGRGHPGPGLPGAGPSRTGIPLRGIGQDRDSPGRDRPGPGLPGAGPSRTGTPLRGIGQDRDSPGRDPPGPGLPRTGPSGTGTTQNGAAGERNYR